MSLEIQRGRSKWFYGRVEVNGRSVFKNLGVPIEGTPPVSLRDEGDPAFERSRGRAQVALEKFEAELRKTSQAEELYQTILELRTGARMRSVPLAEMAAAWNRLPRKKRMSEAHESQCVAKIAKFVDFMADRFPNVRDMAGVQETMAREFMRKEDDRGQAAKTYNETLKLIRSCFVLLRKEAGLAESPFDGIPLMETDTIHRIPFTIPQIEAILEAAKSAEYIYPLIVVGVCTAMRLGDCAKLCWEKVNLKDGFIDVKASKTRRLVTIPIFPILAELLGRQEWRAEGFVFSELAKQYKVNKQLLTARVREVMSAVGFGDANELMPGAPTEGVFHVKRERGLRQASVRDFQSFRVTWVTIALNASVPIDLVRKVTGHQTVEIVLTSYHQPSRDDFRRELASKLPAAITGGKDNCVFKLRTVQEKLSAMNETNWQTVRDELLAGLANQVPPGTP